MIKWLICHLWGHKTVHRAVSGNTMRVSNRLSSGMETVPLYVFLRTSYCTRCGKDIPVEKADPR